MVDREAYANVMDCLSSAADVGAVAFFAVYLDASLTALGLVMVVDSAFFLALNVIISIQAGWISRFEVGLFGGFAPGNKSVFLDVCRTAVVSPPSEGLSSRDDPARLNSMPPSPSRSAASWDTRSGRS